MLSAIHTYKAQALAPEPHGKADLVAGMLVFQTLAEARRAGFEVVDRTPTGYVVRAKTATGWVLALVEESLSPTP